MGLLKLQAAPQYSSASIGSVERFHASLRAEARALLSDVEERLDYKADATSPITSWAVRHSSWLRGRYHQHASDEKTSFNRRWGRGEASPPSATSPSSPTSRIKKLLRKLTTLGEG
eukprot:14659383-Alexandrium_andersonii.AAC.1